MQKSLYLLLAIVATSVVATPVPSQSCVVADRNNIKIYNDLLDSYLDVDYCQISYVPSSNSKYPLPYVGNLPDLNVTIPDAIKPPANDSVKLFALKAFGVRKYQCLRTADAPVTYGWSEQVSSACLFRDDPSKLKGAYKLPVSLLVFNPTLAGRAYYGTGQKPQSSFQVSQVSRVPGATANDLSWELAIGVNHNYQAGPYNTIFDFRKVKYHNRILTSGGAAPSASLCTAAAVGQKVNQPFSAWIVFYGSETFDCPLI